MSKGFQRPEQIADEDVNFNLQVVKLQRDRFYLEYVYITREQAYTLDSHFFFHTSYPTNTSSGFCNLYVHYLIH